MKGKITQVSISKGGLPKMATGRLWAGPVGLEGDGHRHPQFHGGPQKALLMVSSERLAVLRELGFEVAAGSLGENLTTEGIDYAALRSGMRFRAGGAVIELTTLRTPCGSLDVFNSEGRRIQPLLMDAKAKSGDVGSPRWAWGGFYAAVLHPGFIGPGDILELAGAVV